MKFSGTLSKKSYLIYGLGLTGISVLNFLKKLKVKNIYTWDDKKKLNPKIFINYIKKVDHIVISPGINIKHTKFNKVLLKNKKKIITDLDLFYLQKPEVKSIVITGTNGKSTTCKILERVLKFNKTAVKTCGNIGSPILNINIKNKNFIIIEASSFQLAYSKYVKPNYAMILNISNDHLDWHGSKKNYLNSKLKIFSNQDNKDHAFLSEQKYVKLFRKKNFLGSLKIVKTNSFSKLKKDIKNKYLLSKPNEKNLLFVYSLIKFLKIKNNIFLKAINSFEGLSHRYEIFYKKKNVTFINDSKATSFEASKYAIKNNKNIFWIVGGKNKLGDSFELKNLKKNIIKSFIIGKKTAFFKNQLSNHINYKVSYTLQKAVVDIFKDLKKFNSNDITVLFSPASASYDQFKNFMIRGDKFKFFVRKYAKKYL